MNKLKSIDKIIAESEEKIELIDFIFEILNSKLIDIKTSAEQSVHSKKDYDRESIIFKINELIRIST